jgi:hypothetical protein
MLRSPSYSPFASRSPCTRPRYAHLGRVATQARSLSCKGQRGLRIQRRLVLLLFARGELGELVHFSRVARRQLAQGEAPPFPRRRRISWRSPRRLPSARIILCAARHLTRGRAGRQLVGGAAPSSRSAGHRLLVGFSLTRGADAEHAHTVGNVFSDPLDRYTLPDGHPTRPTPQLPERMLLPHGRQVLRRPGEHSRLS